MRESAAESLSSLFEPEVVLPSQFNTNELGGLSGGERKLMAAILSDGIEAFISEAMAPTRSSRSKNPDPAEWVNTKDESYIFSFDNVCNCLGIDSDYLRLGLARYVDVIRRNQIGSLSAWKKIRRPRK